MRLVLPVVTNCDDCGACCTGQAALPIHLINPTSGMFPVSPLPESLRIELAALTQQFMSDGFPPDDSPCIWYDAATRRCKHYEHRPEICRDSVKAGDDACHHWRRKLGIKRQSFVLRAGRLIPA